MDNLKEEVKEELEKLINVRENFLQYFERNLEKLPNSDIFDFSNDPKLDAKEVYSNFYKLDYQARKLRSFLVKAYGLKP